MARDYCRHLEPIPTALPEMYENLINYKSHKIIGKSQGQLFAINSLPSIFSRVSTGT